MRSEYIAPSFVYFLSGVAAAAAVNLITALPTGSVRGLEALIVAACSVPWFATSLLLALSASLLEEARQKCDRLPTERLSDDEVRQTWTTVFDGIRGRFRFRVLLAILFALSGTVAMWLTHFAVRRDTGAVDVVRNYESVQHPSAKQTNPD